jgi:hypothetical protein
MLHVAHHVEFFCSLLWEQTKKKQAEERCKKTLREYQFRFVRASLLHSRLFVLFIAIQNEVECKKIQKNWKVKRRAKSKAKWWAMLRKGKLNICYICQTFSHDFWPFKPSNNILQNFNLLFIFIFTLNLLWMLGYSEKASNFWRTQTDDLVSSWDTSTTSTSIQFIIIINTFLKVILLLWKTFHLKWETRETN